MNKVRDLKVEIMALVYACRDPRMPWAAKGLAVLVVAYALSPIDLIPDFIPFLGYLDDLVLIPLGIFLVLRLIPAEVMADARTKAALQNLERLPEAKAAAVVILLIWAAVLLAIFYWAASRLGWIKN
jgi:uncharacterized membrane protein YkvA (DUF1232 family)